jgi:regulatory protein
MNDNERYLEKLEHFCAYQERCTHDVIQKMKKLNVPEHRYQELISQLENTKFIDNERYARAWVRSKIGYKKDGLAKIKFQLYQKGIAQDIILDALSDIDQDHYFENLKSIVLKKWTSLENEKNDAKRKQKLVRFLISKGYRLDEINRFILTLKP